MKQIYILLLITLFGICNGQLVDPKHSIHHGGELSEDCMICHICQKGEVPTTSNPCLRQCSRPFQVMNAETQDIVIIDRLVEKYEPVVFMHGYHANMSAMSGGCTNCHHFASSIDNITSCGAPGCHDAVNVVDIRMSKPSLKGAYHRQCMGCHREWSHETECAFCHAEIQGGKSKIATMDKTDIVGSIHPQIEAEIMYVYTTTYEVGKIVTFHHADHVDLFGLKCTDCHKGDSCFRCHDTAKHERKEIQHVETCCKCHMEDNCGYCHAKSAKPAFEHGSSTGWPLIEYHKTTDCSNCHGPVKEFTKPSTVCTSCHIHWDVGVFDHTVTGISLSDDHVEEDCENCHIDRDFSIEPTCDNCHDVDITYPEYSPGD